MKPFAAWLAMGHSRRPLKLPVELEDGSVYGLAMFGSKRCATRASTAPPLHVLIAADTEENRKKLGMEE